MGSSLFRVPNVKLHSDKGLLVKTCCGVRRKDNVQNK